MSLSVGDKLGPYEILAPIGVGGMGEVWKARDTRLDRIVAIKRLKGRHTARFEQEARAIAAVNHPNICQIHDIGPDYLVLEYLEGQPLKGPMAAPDAVRAALQIAAALEAAHAKGLLHRDLKPGNILMTAAGAKLLDFGLAKLVADEDATQTIGVSGTPLYMSPEQAEGRTLDARSDVFSLGAVLYELLAGRRAFHSLGAVLRDEPRPLEASPGLEKIVWRCLRKSPADRYASAAEVRAALEQLSAKPQDRQPSIAVLPFANMSDDREQEYFSDGLAEEIINALTQVQGLKVIARTSAFAFKGKNEDVRKIAETLGVSNVLEGSVRRVGNRLRITAQLISAADGTHLWSQRYDREMTDVFAIQDQISQAISEALEVRLAPRARTVNVEAYQNYLKGIYHRVRYTPESLAKAKECFEQALAIDPNYAPAYSGIAAYYYTLAVLGLKPAGDVAVLAKAAAEKALALDPANSEAHTVLAVIAGIFDYDWNVAESHHRKAMAAEPVPAMVRFRYVMNYLLPLGRFADALEQSRLALQTDPLSMVLHWGMVWSMYSAAQHHETIEYARRAMEIDANFYFMWYGMGLAQLQVGFTQEAIASLKRVVELAPWYDMGAWSLAVAYHRAGDREHSREWARKLAGSRGHTVGAALYYAAAGEVDTMFEVLDAAHQQREYYLCWVQLLPSFDPSRADPRFQALLSKMNLA